MRLRLDALPVPPAVARMVGKVGNAAMYCTGITVGPSMVLTSAACVHAGFMTYEINQVVANVVGVHRQSEFWPDATDDGDYALLELDTPLGDRFGTLPLVGAPPCVITLVAVYTSLSVSTVQFAPGFDPGVQVQCTMKVVSTSRCVHDCDTSSVGSPGAPLLVTVRNTTASTTCVVGMHLVGDSASKNRIGSIVAAANAHLSWLQSTKTTTPPTTTTVTTPTPTTTVTTPTTMTTSTPTTSPTTTIAPETAPPSDKSEATAVPISNASSDGSSSTNTIVYVCIAVVLIAWFIVLGCMLRRRLSQQRDLMTPATAS
ncbi:hypothetical protein SDRG_13132 [Saprolegnia diclina VS20]|uniref:Peptidase S1 domain-containing protein n=1 Tax=Saprolegnia diclina (strain VS20) TaxID=1156394 RepID=T0Q3F5_SAPDV|nr:hypothetical protein SDRG_13132 [Saprolegnia diclina VS20]EQC29101.1 hypothetical protein SDRG_13132 [Saprolegnia diclina VS20]|eukprot:XP_008617436.1 hypothetical protein SDRG_13132 [Saprolegnia diclina VS20]